MAAVGAAIGGRNSPSRDADNFLAMYGSGTLATSDETTYIGERRRERSEHVVDCALLDARW